MPSSNKIRRRRNIDRVRAATHIEDAAIALSKIPTAYLIEGDVAIIQEAWELHKRLMDRIEGVHTD